MFSISLAKARANEIDDIQKAQRGSIEFIGNCLILATKSISNNFKNIFFNKNGPVIEEIDDNEVPAVSFANFIDSIKKEVADQKVVPFPILFHEYFLFNFNYR